MVYGTGSKNLGTRKIQGAKCQSCGVAEIHAQAVSSYVHVFWIPVFPYRKKLTTACQSCLQVLEKKQMLPELKEKLALEKSHFKTPFYLFSGLILLGLLIAFVAYSLNEDKKALAKNVKELQAKDILIFKIDSNEYSFAEIESHRNDSIFMHYGNYSYDGTKPSKKTVAEERAGKADFFDTDIYYFTQKQIDSLHEKGELVEIYKYK